MSEDFTVAIGQGNTLNRFNPRHYRNLWIVAVNIVYEVFTIAMVRDILHLFSTFYPKKV